MAVYYTRSAPIAVKNFLIGGGAMVYVGDTIVYESIVNCNFPSRPSKPHPLSDTGGSVVKLTTNVTSVKFSPRMGAVPWVYGSYLPKTYVRSTESDAKAAALRAYANFVAKGPLNAGVAIAEGKQTFDMVTRRVNQLANIIKNLKSGNIAGLQQQLKNIDVKKAMRNVPYDKRLSKGWLELYLGWKPLINDVYGAVEAYHRKMTANDTYLRSKAFNPSKDGFGATLHGKVRSSTLLSLDQLGLINPLAIAWEKVPLSFVIDWFLPIGDIIRGLTVGASVSGISGTYVYEVVSITMVGPKLNVWYQTSKSIQRKLYTGLTLGSIGIRVFNFESERLATAVALLRTRG